MIQSSRNSLPLLTFLPFSRTIMMTAAKAVAHQLYKTVGQFWSLDRGSGGASLHMSLAIRCMRESMLGAEPAQPTMGEP